MPEGFPLEPAALLLVLLAAFAAGFVDAVAGGGGLITVPALLLALPDAPIAAVLATNKASSVGGTAAAAAAYARRVEPPWRILLPAVGAALPASWLGARAVSGLDASLVRPAILGILVLLALWTWLRPDLGARVTSGIPHRLQPAAALAVGGSLGFYDGLLGPGTGTFLVIAFIAVFGRDFLRATAVTKFVNGASNLGALLFFAPAGSVLWRLALPMALCNVLGGLLGSRLALSGGNRWIRRVFLLALWALIARLGWAVLRGE